MKIVYSCANRIGAGIQLSRFLDHIDQERHEVRIAGFYGATEPLTHIDWTLDALRHPYSKKNRQGLIELFGRHGLPDVGYSELSFLMDDINDYNPDLIICDYEPILANIAKSLGVRLWYCSPIHALDGIKWKFGQLKYKSKLELYRKTLPKLPTPERVFIYSPFGDIIGGPELKPGYEWVKPYHIHGQEGNLNKSGGSVIIQDRKRISILSKILNCVPPFDLTMFSWHEYNLSHLTSINLSKKENVDIYRDIVSRSNWVFTTGETSYIADALYNGAKVCVAPNLNDPEALLNAIIVRNYNLGDDVAQVELMENYAVEIIERSYSSWANADNHLKNKGEGLCLHTEIEKICHQSE